MPQRKQNGIPFVLKAPRRDKKGETPICIKRANKDLLAYWHEEIQKPFIDKDSDRVDYRWNWPIIVSSHSILANQLKQDPKCYAIGKDLDSIFIPIALILIAESYPALHDKTKKCSFVWYMAGAPQEYCVQFITEPELASVGRLCLDIGITTSFNNLYGGNLGLHADPKGGMDLFNFYEQKCNLLHLNSKTWISLFRRNDGRYFYADSDRAVLLSRNFDHLRS